MDDKAKCPDCGAEFNAQVKTLPYRVFCPSCSQSLMIVQGECKEPDRFKECLNLLRKCRTAMSEKLMNDNGWQVLGWEERFNEVSKEVWDYLEKVNREEANRIFEIISNELCSDLNTICPFCNSTDVEQTGHAATLLGGKPDPNHHWYSQQCKSCHETFTKEVKEGNVWYTKDHFVLKGVASCFERYYHSCKFCNGKVCREFRQLDGVTPLGGKLDVLTYGPDGSGQRCFLKCKDCGQEMEYPSEHWS